MDDVDSTTSEKQKQAFEYAWKWFDLHANQRMQSVNFYLAVSVALGGGFATSFQAKLYVISIAAGLLLLIFTVLFYFLEHRTKRLIRLGEAALHPLEMQLTEAVGTTIQLTQLSAATASDMITYGKVFHAMFWVIGCMACLATMAALLLSVQP